MILHTFPSVGLCEASRDYIASLCRLREDREKRNPWSGRLVSLLFFSSETIKLKSAPITKTRSLIIYFYSNRVMEGVQQWKGAL